MFLRKLYTKASKQIFQTLTDPKTDRIWQYMRRKQTLTEQIKIVRVTIEKLSEQIKMFYTNM